MDHFLGGTFYFLLEPKHILSMHNHPTDCKVGTYRNGQGKCIGKYNKAMNLCLFFSATENHNKHGEKA